MLLARYTRYMDLTLTILELFGNTSKSLSIGFTIYGVWIGQQKESSFP